MAPLYSLHFSFLAADREIQKKDFREVLCIFHLFFFSVFGSVIFTGLVQKNAMVMNSQLYERYQRQIILAEFGEEGQQKLAQAKVLVIGAGGLGCPVLQYLTAAGTGILGVVDDDVVALNNLHRQVLYSVTDIGSSKAETAARRLNELNPEIKIIPYNARLTTENALDLIDEYDIVIDGTDNFSTRYMINDACVLLDKPLVYGAISQFEGQVAVFNYSSQQNSERTNYRDIFPTSAQ